MRLFQLKPALVAWWGVAVLIGGAVLTVTVSPLVYSFFDGGRTLAQDVMVAIEFGLLVARAVLPPLGASLIAAGLVMSYIDKHQLRGKPVNGSADDQGATRIITSR